MRSVHVFLECGAQHVVCVCVCVYIYIYIYYLLLFSSLFYLFFVSVGPNINFGISFVIELIERLMSIHLLVHEIYFFIFNDVANAKTFNESKFTH